MTLTLHLWMLIPLALFFIPPCYWYSEERHQTGYFSGLGTMILAAMCWPACAAVVITKLACDYWR